MSSEVYVSPEVRRAQQIALHDKMLSDIRQVMDEIRSAQSGASGNGIIDYTYSGSAYDGEDSDTVLSGFDAGAVGRFVLRTADAAGPVELQAFDLSDAFDEQLISQSERSKRDFIREISTQIDAMVADTIEKVHERNRFVAFVNGLAADAELDFDYFKTLVQQNLDSLSAVFSAEASDVGALAEYEAVCELLGIAAAQPPNDIAAETERLKKQLYAKREIRFVHDNLAEVFAELGLSIGAEFELNGLNGKCVTDSSITNCAMFMSADNDGIVFETFAEVPDGTTLSHNERLAAEASAIKLCEKHREVVRLMAQRGIDFNIVEETTPRAESLRTVGRSVEKRRAKTAAREQAIGG